jgi:hypothetical protein
MAKDKDKGRKAERAFWANTLEISEECLELDRDFLARIEGRGGPGGADPLNPELWESFIKARKNLVDYTTENLAILAQDKESQARNPDVMTRLESTLGEVMLLEERLTSFLRDNLGILRDTIDGISKNQAIFSAYGRSLPKQIPGSLETVA